MGKSKGKSKKPSEENANVNVPVSKGEPLAQEAPLPVEQKSKPENKKAPNPKPSDAEPVVVSSATAFSRDSTTTKPANDVGTGNESAKADTSASADADAPVPMICGVCELPAISRCGGCQKVGYCSKEHQKVHWKQHKGECCPWKISENRQLGRYLIAARDIKPGEILIQEKPLLITPPKITPPVCLGCYSDFSLDGAETDDGRGVKPYSCRNSCGWPMCKSSSCHNSKDHEAECRMANARGQVIIRRADCEHPLYQTIGVLRALGLKDREPQSFDKLLGLVANTEQRSELHRKMELEGEQMPGSSSSKPGELGREASVKLIQEFFHRPDVSEEWIVKLMGIIETNGHEIPIPDEDGHINRRIIGVYHTASFLEHNCLPNCVKSFDLSTKSILIRSCVAIKKGDHLSISYVDPLWGTNDRVNLLRMTKFFTCTCTRCKDPSELGSHVSSLRCQHLKCMQGGPTTPLPKQGMIVPVDPYKPDSEWKCISCGEDYNASYASSLVHKAGEELEALGEKIGDITAKEEYLRRFTKTLSRNHFYLLEVKVELAQFYGRTQDEPLPILAPKKLLRKIQLCEELLIVFEVIAPGYNRLRALIIYELQAAVLALSRIRRSVEEISMEKHLEELMQCGKWMTEVIKVLGWESHNSIERKRAVGAERDLQQLRASVLSLQPPSDDIDKKARKTSPPPQPQPQKVPASAPPTEKSQPQPQPPTPSPQPQPPTKPKAKSQPQPPSKSYKAKANSNENGNSKAERKRKEQEEREREERSHLTVDEESFIEEVF